MNLQIWKVPDEMKHQLETPNYRSFTIQTHIYLILTTDSYNWEEEKERNRGKSVAGVGNQQAGFADSAVADGDALNEPRCTHFQIRDLFPNSNNASITLTKLEGVAEKGGNEMEIKLK